MRESALRRASLVTLFSINAGAVREPRLHARYQVAPAAALQQLIVIRALVFQRIVQVEAGPVGIEKGGANLSARTEVSVRSFTVDLEALRQAIRAAHSDATVIRTAAACC